MGRDRRDQRRSERNDGLHNGGHVYGRFDRRGRLGDLPRHRRSARLHLPQGEDEMVSVDLPYRDSRGRVRAFL